MTVDPQQVLAWIVKSEHLDRFETATLDGVPHLALTYERHLALEEMHRPTVTLVTDSLGIGTGDLPPLRSAYRKVAPRALSDSVANYPELVRALAGTQYADHLT